MKPMLNPNKDLAGATPETLARASVRPKARLQGRRETGIKSDDLSFPPASSESPGTHSEPERFRTPSSIFQPLPETEFDIIYADPPWHYKGQLQHAGSGNGTTGGATAHYQTVSMGGSRGTRCQIDCRKTLPIIHVDIQSAIPTNTIDFLYCSLSAFFSSVSRFQTRLGRPARSGCMEAH